MHHRISSHVVQKVEKMKVAFGLKAHSGWGVLVVVGVQGAEFHVVDRRRIELVEDKDANWAKQPYHAAEGLQAGVASNLVTRGIAAAHRSAFQEMRAALNRSHDLGHEIVACTVLVPNPMPDWSTDEILAVHFRMHKAEGVLFPNALVRGATECGLNVTAIPEKQLNQYAQSSLARPMSSLMTIINTLGKSVGAPWGKDQKSAALAAMIGLHRIQITCKGALLCPKTVLLP
jgi:hypothetical protein